MKKEWLEDTVIQAIKEFLDELGTVDAVIELVMDLQGRDSLSLPAFEKHLDTTKLEHRKMLISTFVNAIYLYDDKAVIALNYKDGTKTVNFNDMECAFSQRASIPGSDLEILSP